MDIISRWRTTSQSSEVKQNANFGAVISNPNCKKWRTQSKKKTGNRRPEKRVETRNCLVCKKKSPLMKDCCDPRKEDWIRSRQTKGVRSEVVDRAAKDIRTSAASSDKSRDQSC